MHKLTITTGDGEYTRSVETFVRAMELSKEILARGYTHEEPEAFVFYPPHAISRVRVEEIKEETKKDDGKERQRSEVAKGKQRRHRE